MPAERARGRVGQLGPAAAAQRWQRVAARARALEGASLAGRDPPRFPALPPPRSRARPPRSRLEFVVGERPVGERRAGGHRAGAVSLERPRCDSRSSTGEGVRSAPGNARSSRRRALTISTGHGDGPVPRRRRRSRARLASPPPPSGADSLPRMSLAISSSCESAVPETVAGLERQDAGPGAGEHVRGDAAGPAETDDQDVCVAHLGCSGQAVASSCCSWAVHSRAAPHIRAAPTPPARCCRPSEGLRSMPSIACARSSSKKELVASSRSICASSSSRSPSPSARTEHRERRERARVERVEPRS